MGDYRMRNSPQSPALVSHRVSSGVTSSLPGTAVMSWMAVDLWDSPRWNKTNTHFYPKQALSLDKRMSAHTFTPRQCVGDTDTHRETGTHHTDSLTYEQHECAETAPSINTQAQVPRQPHPETPETSTEGQMAVRPGPEGGSASRRK